ncbi:MAG: PolC-type DNA polymerase III [Selenomonadaceae bacterium]|nr:PolC-type DNA polymerase III [Selenomonadaceae bacterium]
MPCELRPQEKAIENLLRQFPFEEEQIKNFVEFFFLRRVIIREDGLIVDFLYLESIKPTLEFTQKVEYFFQLNFNDKLTCEFSKTPKRTLLTYKFHRKQQDIWDKSLMPLKPPQIFNPNDFPDEFIPADVPITMPIKTSKSARVNKEDEIIFEDNSLPLVHEGREVITPQRKTDVQKNIVPTDKIFVEKISGSVKNIADIYLMDEATAHKVIIIGELMHDDRNGAKLREFKTGTCSVSFALVDDTDGIFCKKIFDAKEQAENFQSRIKDLSCIKIKGTARFDKYSEEMTVMIETIQPLDTAKNPREDNAEVKRVELHVHTTMSAMDSIISPEKLITTAANWNWSAVAITDHGVVQAFPFAADVAEKLAKKGKHIKIIYGMEGYLTTEENQKYAYHVILLAKNKVGLGNLYRLVSISQLKYFYRKPRIPKDILAKFREGLIIGSACAQGELISAILEGKDDVEIDEIANFYDYIEIQPIHNNNFIKDSEQFPTIKTDEDLKNLNRRVADIAQKLNKPLVATCDAHFLDPEDDIFRAIMMSGKGFDNADNQPPIFLRTTEEMLKEFDYLDEDLAYQAVVTNPNAIADSIEELKPIPDGLYSPQMPGADAEITEMSYKRAMALYGDPLPKIVKDRLEQELRPITTHGFSVLYLIAQKLVKKSNDDGYLVGSRGSVGSSFVAAMTGITEVNPLPPHYRCPKCQHSEFFTKGEAGCGYDLPNKNCPICGHPLIKDGHDIPFAVFLGFDGDKVPDIDLNFSGEYQSAAHKYTEILFGRHNVYRAGTISTVAEKTAYGFVKKYYDERDKKKHGSFIAKMANGFTGVKRTTGQHPAGIMVVPRDMDIHYFTPIQRPAEDKTSTTITTHFDYHSISSRLVKLDILGHDDPTVIKMLENITHIDPLKIPLDDKPTLSLFSSTKAIGLKPSQIGTKSGTFGIPEFRTSFTRAMIDDTSPKCFSDLVRISGFSHGTDVWLGNAQELIKNQICTLQDAISARDDIMMYLIHNGVEALKAFKIMEGVRKGKGIKPDDVEMLRSNNIPEWYIDSCQKIKYLFPRAHATAYVMMAYRIAYCKVHYPLAYYSAYFSIRADEFNADEIAQGENFVKMKIEELEKLSQTRKLELKENEKLAVLQVAYEMFLRGMGVERVNLYESDAEKFIVLDRENKLLPPLSSLVGVGVVAARNIATARKDGEFSSIQDLVQRSGINKTAVEALRNHGSLKGMEETNQISLFGF